jgi:hypothetical protein
LKRTLQGPNRLAQNCLGLETRVGSAIPAVIRCEASPDRDCARHTAAEEKGERGHEDAEDGELADLDAHFEGKQRYQQIRPRKLQLLLQYVGEPEPVD